MYMVETINKLPEELHLDKISSHVYNSKQRFFTKKYLFSNHNLSPMIVEKAPFFGDTETASPIMSTNDPGEHKRLGNRSKALNN